MPQKYAGGHGAHCSRQTCQDPSGARMGSGKFQVRPEPPGEHADPVPGGEGDARDEPLHEKGTRHQAGGQRGGKKERSGQKARRGNGLQLSHGFSIYIPEPGCSA